MKSLESLTLRALNLVEPETGLNSVTKLLRLGLVPLPPQYRSGRLAVKLAGLELPNPLGLAAGIDKDAVVMHALSKFGFGFIEVGAVTPAPQDGNPKPRLFRLQQEQATINRLGFNSGGAEAVAKRLISRPNGAVIGLNVGANKESVDRINDFVSVIETCGSQVDFLTVNVSSPNTTGLRKLQAAAALKDVLAKSKTACRQLTKRPKLFVKLEPDLSLPALRAATEVAAELELDAIIATNTRAVNFPNGVSGQDLGLKSSGRNEKGGLSGRPLFDISTRVLAEIYRITEGSVPLIGVGGIATADDAFKKIQAGATALQLYTALAYRGFSLVAEILSGLDKRLSDEGFGAVSDAVGTDNSNWRYRD